MNSVPEPSGAKRAYRLGVRAATAEAAAARVLDAFAARLRDGWFDEIRLEDVARDAGVSVQTVIRRFGGKEGLLEAAQLRLGQEIRTRRAVAPGDVAAAVRLVIEDYEASGELVLRALAQEDRYPAIRHVTDVGRAGHRDWLREVFDAWLAPLDPTAAEETLDALVVATDLYVWKLIRRDLQRPPAELQAHMERMIRAALAAAVVPGSSEGAQP